MHSVFAGIHIQNKPKEVLLLDNINFENSVLYLKREIAEKLQSNANCLELIYNGLALDDDLKLSEVVKPNGTVHCFLKTKQYAQYQPTMSFVDDAEVTRVQELFNITAHIQCSVNSRVMILQKILAEYPEFRRNLGAQALIRDSVLSNTLHHKDVIKNIADHYPIICEAAPFIVDTIKKEVKRTTTVNLSEPATDSTNSSEEENSLSGGGAEDNQSIRTVTRQQLQAALAEIGASFNSLSSIAQRNSDTTATTAPTATATASSARISSELFRNGLEQAWNSLGQSGNSQQMDTSESPAEASTQQVSLHDSSDIPPQYRTHQYAEQLSTMAQMGFVNYDENLVFLNLTNGDIENAINLLMGAIN